MKKCISLFLVVILIMGLCACGGSSIAKKDGSASNESSTAASGSDAVFMAGFGKGDITPKDLGVQLSGYGNEATRLSTGFLSYIYAIAVAVTDAEGNSAVIVSVDNGALGESFCDEIRKWAKLEYGIPTENIIISALHQHSCPVSGDSKYVATLDKGIKEAITMAMEDRTPAEMYTNSVETEALNFVRRVWAKDGTLFTSHSGSLESGFDRYETEADNVMQLIKFTREEKDDIIMVNFQCHPHMGTSSAETDIHSDWPGAMRDAVTEALGAQCIYVGGAGANLNSTSYVSSHNVTTPTNNFIQHGQRAAQYVIGAEDSYTKADTGLIRCMEQTNTYETDHSLDYLLSVATIVNDVRNKEGITAAHALVKNYPELNSTFQASSIVAKAALGPTKTCRMSVITFGDVAFTAHPYEMFDTNGKEVKAGTVGNENYAAEDQLDNPFAMTFVVSCANGANSYMPAVNAFDNGGYERDQTRYARGTGELIVGDVLHMLNELYEG